MIIAENVAKSAKHLGAFEAKIIDTLTEHFQKSGYEVIPHSSLNIAWGRVLSDIDLLLIKDQLLTYIEVKSSRDNLARAHKQIDRIKDYIDYAYVATDKHVKKWNYRTVGLVFVKDKEVKVVRKAMRFQSKPRFYSVASLKKKCLVRFFGTGNPYLLYENKYDMAEKVYTEKECNRLLLKEIVTCGELCSSKCPIGFC